MPRIGAKSRTPPGEADREVPLIASMLGARHTQTQRGLPRARWFAVRRAQNRKPATYRCPLCGQHLPSLSEHMLIVPEGDPQRRRHAHTECVLAARRAGRLPTRDEWLETQPRPPSLARRAAGAAKRLTARAATRARD